MNKKKWFKPKLIILLRVRSEETVLLTCKGSWPAVTNQPHIFTSGCDEGVITCRDCFSKSNT